MDVGFMLIAVLALLVLLGVPLAIVLLITAVRGRTRYAAAQPCPRCGQPIVPTGRFCHHCGERLRE